MPRQLARPCQKWIIRSVGSSTQHNAGPATDAVPDSSMSSPRKAVWHARFPRASANVLNPRTIFPWRHRKDLLPRLIPGSEEFYAQGGTFGPRFFSDLPHWCLNFVTRINSKSLGIPLYEGLLMNGWKQELADSSAWAFSQAVAGMISNVYEIPFSDVRPDDGAFDVDLNHSLNKPSDRLEEEFPNVQYMMEDNLRTLYESAHENGRDQLQIVLQMKPVDTALLSLLYIPFLTRDKVNRDPELQNYYPGVISRSEEFHESGFYTKGWRSFAEGIRELGRSQAELHNDHVLTESTTIAQVLVWCDEIFCVTDLASGEVLQGHGDGKVRRVPHVVRLEMVVRHKYPLVDGKSQTPSTPHLGNWVITDWDDLLEGNIWYR